MKVKMITKMAGPQGVANPGQEIDLPEKLARSLVDGGYATKVQESKTEPVVESATVETGGEKDVDEPGPKRKKRRPKK